MIGKVFIKSPVLLIKISFSSHRLALLCYKYSGLFSHPAIEGFHYGRLIELFSEKIMGNEKLRILSSNNQDSLF